MIEFLNTSINIYKVDLFILSNKIGKTEKHVNILEYDEHCVGIKNLSALLNGQIHKRDKHMNIYLKCHDKFENKQKFEEHIDICIKGKTNIEMPGMHNIRSYKSCGAELYHPYTITLDFECLLKKIKKEVGKKSEYINEHIPTSFCFNTIDGTKLIRSDNVEELMKLFNKSLVEFGKRYNEIRRISRETKWTPEIIEKIKEFNKCRICNKKIENDTDKYRDNNHVTGEFIGVTCKSCKLPLEKKDWYTLLGDKNISDHDLNFAIKVYKHTAPSYSYNLKLVTVFFFSYNTSS
ncbi:hypothetical protein QE152_g4735 [Popillia japonica]|uniref:Uncharacterized protein n=1 Tax=Popillia japonica TaxID=7064 RepID=A0AAW1MX19_POPJA